MDDRINSIDTIFSTCMEKYGLIIKEENRSLYIGFNERQLGIHEIDLDYKPPHAAKFPHIDLVSDKLYIWSVFIRQTEIRVDEFSEDKELVDDFNKLGALRYQGSDKGYWIDDNLYRIYQLRENDRRKFKSLKTMITYKDILVELCEDPLVVDVWGRKLSYENDVRGKMSHKTV